MAKTVSEVIQHLETENYQMKEKVLYDLGLFEKVYSDTSSKEYPHEDMVDGKRVYYKIATAKVTDEEWNKIFNLTQERTKLSNISIRPKGVGFAFSMFILGLIFQTAGLIVGLLMMGDNFLIGIMIIISAFIIGCVCTSLELIIGLLNDIRSK